MNTRAILAARVTGKGRQGLADFCGIMSMNPPLAKDNFTNAQRRVACAAQEAAKANMKAVARHLC